jgi:hypothetical protein
LTLYFLFGLFCSAVIGLSLGLIGGGGSIITLPVLVYLLHVEPYSAVGMSLAVVGGTSLVGAGLHHRAGNVNLRVAALFALSGMLGAFFGARLMYLFTPPALLLTFAALMTVVSLRMLWTASAEAVREETPRASSLAKLLPAGLAVGVLTGFLGVGGGFLIVPALALFGGLGMKPAVGTSLVVIAVNCAAGLAGHLQHGAFDLRLTALVTAIAMAGAVAGARFSHAAHPATLRRIFAWFVLAVAVFLIYRNLPGLILR